VALRACLSFPWPTFSYAVSFLVWFIQPASAGEPVRPTSVRLAAIRFLRLHFFATVSFPVSFCPLSILATDRLLPRVDKRPRRTSTRSPRAVPWEIAAPVGCRHDNPKCRRPTSRRRPRPRLCLRQGCGRKYQPKRWNQRYCQDPDCQRLVRRWQAARRQARRRQDDAAKAQHAQTQRARRQRPPSSTQAPTHAEVTPARGHAAKIISPTPLCDRPGCHEPPAKALHPAACFCSRACRQAVQRVRDRERKWLWRGTFQGRQARKRHDAAARARRLRPQHDAAGTGPTPTLPP
jgi:hypothetical protein